jgi:excisionase family DNA binding protein
MDDDIVEPATVVRWPLGLTAAGREETASESGEVLTAKEVERLLKIDVKTIYSYVERGLLPYVRIQSNLRFLKSEILKWIEEHRFRPKPPASPR